MNRSTALLTSLAVIGSASLVHATDARVESMGKHDTYFMDDVSVWNNPANANIYPNYLMGELGQMRQNGAVSTQNAFNGSTGSAFARYNTDPQKPWFGAIFAKSFSADAEGGNRYPQVVIGGAFNRPHELSALIPDSVVMNNAAGSSKLVAIYPSAVRADGLIGFATASGVLVGAKLHLTLGDSSTNGFGSSTTLWAATVGVNAPIAQGLDFEAAVTAASVDVEASDSVGFSYKSESDLSWILNSRAFISVPVIAGEIVPAVSIKQLDAPGLENDLEMTIGSGVNVSLDRGFFWVGADYTYSSVEARLAGGNVTADGKQSLTTTDANTGRVSFGIERNVWWDWFVLRVGGQKIFTAAEVSGKTVGGQSYTHSTLSTNPEGDGTEKDQVSFGFGLNIEDKLKVDAVMAEDILFTGGNLFGGPADHILSRISATYSF